MSDIGQPTSLIPVKEASKITGKSVITIKRLVAKNIIYSEKIKGNNGLEIRVDKNQILDHFNIPQPISNDIAHDLPQDIGQPISSQNEFEKNPYLKVILDQLQDRSKENIKLHDKIDKLHDLLENQQKLTLQLQTQITTLTDNQNLLLTSRYQDGDKGFVIVDENEEKPKRKKFLGIF
jgi:hypothetical protein